MHIYIYNSSHHPWSLPPRQFDRAWDEWMRTEGRRTSEVIGNYHEIPWAPFPTMKNKGLGHLETRLYTP